MENGETIKEAIRNTINFLSTVDDSSLFDQMHYLQNLLDFADSKQYDIFIEKINSAELWGGPGSVWESEFGMTTEQRRIFESILLQLLSRMKEERIIKRRATTVLKILSKKQTIIDRQ